MILTRARFLEFRMTALLHPIVLKPSPVWPVSFSENQAGWWESDFSGYVSNLYTKSCALDPVSSSVFQRCRHRLVPIITRIVNLSLQGGQVPDRFKVGVIKPLGTLWNYNGDGNGNVKNAIGLMSKKQFCTCITPFCTFLCSPCITTTWNDLSLLGKGNDKAINSDYHLCQNSGAVPSVQLQPKFSSIKSERMRSLFFSDVFLDVAVVGW